MFDRMDVEIYTSKKTGNMSGVSCFVKDAKSIKFNEASKSPVAYIHSTHIYAMVPDNTSNTVTKKMMIFVREIEKMRNGSEMKNKLAIKLLLRTFSIYDRAFVQFLWEKFKNS